MMSPIPRVSAERLAHRVLLTGTLLLAAAQPAHAQLLSDPRVANKSDADSQQSNGDNHQRKSTVEVLSASASEFTVRYSAILSADQEFPFHPVGHTHEMRSEYTVSFEVTAPGSYALEIETLMRGQVDLLSDGLFFGGGTAGISAIQRQVMGGALFETNETQVCAGLGDCPFGDFGPSSTTACDRGASQGNCAAEVNRGRSIMVFGGSSGRPQAHTLRFIWYASVTSKSNNGSEAAVRIGMQGDDANSSADDYPGEGGRDRSSDGHFVTVRLVSLCGNEVADDLVEGSGIGTPVAEECDLGSEVNGTPGSCCTRSCEIAPGFESCDADGRGVEQETPFLVADVVTGPGSLLHAAPLMENVDGTLLFVGDDGETGHELWTSDGTAAGTRLVKDIDPGRAGSFPSAMTTVNGTTFFTARTAATGIELWKTDRTPAGTVLVKDIHPDGDSFPRGFWGVNGTTVFTADDGSGRRLWKTDGTPGGTVPLKDVGAATTNSASFAELEGMLLFNGSGELWRTDGTEAGTALVKDIRPGAGASFPRSFAVVDGVAFFAASTDGAGEEVWKTDGTGEGTVLVKDIRPGPPGSQPGDLTVAGGQVFFVAEDGVTGRELWKTDGTPEGTVLVRDIYPSEFRESSHPGLLTSFDGRLFFTADDGVYGRELWKSDGTAAGTALVKDFVRGRQGGLPGSPADRTFLGVRALEAVDGTLFLQAFTRANGIKLWKSDGTAGGTTLVGAAGGDPTDFAVAGGILFFAAADGTHGRELWATSASCGDGSRNAAEGCDLGDGRNGAPGSCCTVVCAIAAGFDRCTDPTQDPDDGDEDTDGDPGGDDPGGSDDDPGRGGDDRGGPDAVRCGTGGFASLECHLSELLSDRVCGDEPLPKSLRRFIEKRALKARALGRKAAATRKTRRQGKLLLKETRQLRTMQRNVARAGARDRISLGCQQAIEQRIQASRALIETLR